MPTYSELKQYDNYQLVVLATVEPSFRVAETAITNLGGNLWSFSVESIPTRVSFDGVNGTQVLDTPNVANEWKYDHYARTVTFYSISITNKYTLCWVRFFFSSKPTALPWDLSSGYTVQWKPFLAQVSSFNQTIDTETRSIPFESSGTMELRNDLEFFQPKIRKYIWDNKEVRIYRWALESSAIDPELLYSGSVTDMNYSVDSVTLQFSNSIRKLKGQVSACSYFTSNDGFFPVEQRSCVKRLPFGRVDGLNLYPTDANTGPRKLPSVVSYIVGCPIVNVSLNALYDVFQGDTLTLPGGSFTVQSHGKISYGITSTSQYAFAAGLTLRITNTNANFINVSPGDIMVLSPQPGFNKGVGNVVSVSNSAVEVEIIDVPGYNGNTVTFDQNTLAFYKAGLNSLTLSSSVDSSGSTSSATVLDGTVKASKNHEFMVSPIPLYECIKTITNVGNQLITNVGSQLITLNNVDNLRVGDKVTFSSIDGVYDIAFINANLEEVGFSTLPGGLSVSDTMTRLAVQSAWFNNSKGEALYLSPIYDFNTSVISGSERLTVGASVREESQVVVIDCQVRGPFIMENTPNGDNSTAGKFAPYVVGDVVSFYNNAFSTRPIECVIIEKVTDYCVMVYPDKSSNFSGLFEMALLNTSELKVEVTAKKIKNLDNTTQLYVDTYGIGNGTNFIGTTYDVMDYLLSLSGETYDSTKLAELSANNISLVSLALPTERNSRTIPTYLDVLKLMAISSHASLHMDEQNRVTVSPFMAARSSSELVVSDVDLLSLPDISVNNMIAASRIKVSYGLTDYTERFIESVRNEAVYEELSAVSAPDTTVYLYDSADVERYAARELLFRRGAKTELAFSVAPKMTPGFMSVVRCDSRVNPETYRITPDTTVQGVVTSLEIGAGIISSVTLDDMSGYYDTTGTISPNTLPIYSEATNEEAQAFSWIGDGTLIS